MTAALTGLGLSAAAGLNAWVVLLLFNGLYRLLPQEFPGPAAEFLSSQPVLTASVILFLAEFVADKIPIVDHLWNLLQTLLRPVAGALLMLSAVPEASTGGRIGLAAAGAFATLATHFAKSTTRLTSTAATAGVAQIAISSRKTSSPWPSERSSSSCRGSPPSFSAPCSCSSSPTGAASGALSVLFFRLKHPRRTRTA